MCIRDSILDEDRKVNAQKFETAFYAKPDLRNVRPPEEPAKSEPATLDLESLVEQLQKSPELASALAAPVSYTHLDVYKRQGHGGYVWLCD